MTPPQPWESWFDLNQNNINTNFKKGMLFEYFCTLIQINIVQVLIQNNVMFNIHFLTE